MSVVVNIETLYLEGVLARLDSLELEYTIPPYVDPRAIYIDGISIEEWNDAVKYWQENGPFNLLIEKYMTMYLAQIKKPSDTGLYRFEVTSQGMPTTYKYFGDYDGVGDPNLEGSYIDLVMQIDFVYEFDSLGNPTKRITSKYFLDSSGVKVPAKNLTHYKENQSGGYEPSDDTPRTYFYRGQECVEAGKKRRSSIINKLQASGYSLLTGTEVTDLIKECQTEIGVFIEVGNGTLLDKIAALGGGTWSWLDDTVPTQVYTYRDSINSAVTI